MTNDEIIDALGGTAKVAAIFSVTAGAVSQWRKKGIPRVALMYIKKAHASIFKVAKDKL